MSNTLWTNMLDKIIAYEQGELDNAGTLDLFAALVKSGSAWTMQGSYGRAARSLIEAGYLDRDGNILKEATEHE